MDTIGVQINVGCRGIVWLSDELETWYGGGMGTNDDGLFSYGIFEARSHIVES